MDLDIVAGTYDCMIKGFSIDVVAPEEKGLRPQFHERDHSGTIKAVASGGRYLASGGTDEMIKLYDMRTRTEVGTLLQHEGSITWLTFYKDSHLLSASEDGSICVWKCGSWECAHVLIGHKAPVTCVSIHPSGKLALSVSKDRTVRTWNLLTGYIAFTHRQPRTQVAELVAWNPVGDHYALTFEKSITTHEVESGNEISTLEIGKHVNSLLYVKEALLAVGSEHSFIQLFSVSTGECLLKLEGHTNRVKGLALAPGGKLLFSASSDGSVRAWKLAKPLNGSRCVSTVETGSRLTCLAVVNPEGFLKQLKEMTEEENTAGSVEVATSCSGRDTSVSSLKEEQLPAVRKRKRQLKEVESEKAVATRTKAKKTAPKAAAGEELSGEKKKKKKKKRKRLKTSNT